MNKIFTKLKDFVGLHEAEEYYDYEEEMTEDDYQDNDASLEGSQSPIPRSDRAPLIIPTETGMDVTTRSNVIGMPGITNAIAEVVVIEPHSFEEMPQVIQTLRERRSVVLNLTVMDPDEAQRAVDFVAGGTYAIDGHQERIGESVFLFTPSCVKVSTLSGVVHEVTDGTATTTPTAQSPLTTSMPAWPAESSRIAQ